jgi:hypothetical protein
MQQRSPAVCFSRGGAPATVELDEAKCNAACFALLDAEIAIPNFSWGLRCSTGHRPVLAVSFVFGGSVHILIWRNSFVAQAHFGFTRAISPRMCCCILHDIRVAASGKHWILSCHSHRVTVAQASGFRNPGCVDPLMPTVPLSHEILSEVVDPKPCIESGRWLLGLARRMHCL